MSLTGGSPGQSGLAVFRQDRGNLSLRRVAKTPTAPTGLVLTHDGGVLVAAAGSAVYLLDVNRLTTSEADPVLARFSDGPQAGSIAVNVTADDRTLFVSDERQATITVVDLARMRAGGIAPAALLGRIPVGNAPISLVFSPDGQRLYTTSQSAAAAWGWPRVIKRESAAKGGVDTMVAEGAVVVIDVSLARTDPAHAVIARVPAGGSPVRLVLSATGDRAFVTARNSHAVLVFDTAKLVSDPAGARIATVPVGPGPVPLALIAGGTRLVVGNSNRFGSDRDQPSTLTVIDPAKAPEGVGAVIGSISAGSFPRDLRLSPDGRTLFLANYGSSTLQVIDVNRLSVDPPRKRATAP